MGEGEVGAVSVMVARLSTEDKRRVARMLELSIRADEEAERRRTAAQAAGPRAVLLRDAAAEAVGQRTITGSRRETDVFARYCVARTLRDEGHTQDRIAACLGIDRSTVSHTLMVGDWQTAHPREFARQNEWYTRYESILNRSDK